MRSIWKGSISFGLVYIPVRLYAATENRRVSLNMLHRRCGSRIRYLRWCPHCRVEVESEDIVRGYRYGPEQYVIVEDSDLEQLPVPTAKTVLIHNFIEAAEIDPIYYDKTYYLEPMDGGSRAYALLREAMSRSGRVALAQVAVRSRETLACLRVYGDRALAMETMLYPDEVRSVDRLKGLAGDGPVDEDELDLALHLVNRMAGPFQPERFKDNYREALMERIEAKIQGREVTASPAEEPRVIDLMEALRASVAAGGGDGAGRAADAAIPRGQHRGAGTGPGVGAERGAGTGPHSAPGPRQPALTAPRPGPGPSGGNRRDSGRGNIPPGRQ